MIALFHTPVKCVPEWVSDQSIAAIKVGNSKLLLEFSLSWILKGKTRFLSFHGSGSVASFYFNSAQHGVRLLAFHCQVAVAYCLFFQRLQASWDTRGCRCQRRLPGEHYTARWSSTNNFPCFPNRLPSLSYLSIVASSLFFLCVFKDKCFIPGMIRWRDHISLISAILFIRLLLNPEWNLKLWLDDFYFCPQSHKKKFLTPWKSAVFCSICFSGYIESTPGPVLFMRKEITKLKHTIEVIHESNMRS